MKLTDEQQNRVADLCLAALTVVLAIGGALAAIGLVLFSLGSLAWMAVKCAFLLNPFRTMARGMRIGFKFQLGGLWIGAHWSRYNRRLCINLVPCLTVWIALPGGKVPGGTE